MTPFRKHQCDRIQRVFREELSPPEDHGDEPDGIQEVGNELGSWAWPQLCDHNRRAQGGQPHGDATCQSGDEQADYRAIQLMPCVARNLLIDLVGCWPVQFGLDLRPALSLPSVQG